MHFLAAYIRPERVKIGLVGASRGNDGHKKRQARAILLPAKK